MKSKLNAIASTVFVLATALLLTGCPDPPNSQERAQHITEQYAEKLEKAEPYPLDQMNDSMERRGLRERLLRFNDPNKIGYLYEMTPNGQVVAFYTIKGKPSSTSSQLTNSQTITWARSSINGSSTSWGNGVVEAMGDDGSWGPEEGGPNGIFFFTTSGVMLEWNGWWQYSDAPLNLTSKPLLIMDADAKPSSTAGILGPKIEPQPISNNK